MSKRTEWYGYQQKPARIGVYETRRVKRDQLTGRLFTGPMAYSFYDGRNWHWGSASRGGARQNFVMVRVSANPNRVWRGVQYATA